MTLFTKRMCLFLRYVDSKHILVISLLPTNLLIIINWEYNITSNLMFYNITHSLCILVA